MPRGTFFMGKLYNVIHLYTYSHIVVVIIFSIEENNVTSDIIEYHHFLGLGDGTFEHTS